LLHGLQNVCGVRFACPVREADRSAQSRESRLLHVNNAGMDVDKHLPIKPVLLLVFSIVVLQQMRILLLDTLVSQGVPVRFLYRAQQRGNQMRHEAVELRTERFDQVRHEAERVLRELRVADAEIDAARRHARLQIWPELRRSHCDAYLAKGF